MSTAINPPTPATAGEIDAALADLVAGRQWLARASVAQLADLAQQCLAGVAEVAREWVDAASAAKGLSATSPFRGEEVAAGPVATLRYLRLIGRTLADLQRGGAPRLVGRMWTNPDGRLCVPLLPVPDLLDRWLFAGFSAYARMLPGVNFANLSDHLAQPDPLLAASGERGRIALVLGAGNVSSIPATDALGKILHERRAVLLKMNPVNAYLGPIFARALRPLIAAGVLRIVAGDAAVGAAAIEHSSVDEVHITGSIDSFNSIVWGPPGPDRARRIARHEPLLAKPITAELGSVSPWIVVPGRYTPRQLAFTAESVASSITNNASFNCVATKVVLTWRRWPQREEFLRELQSVLLRVPPRPAYYPGACERFIRFAGWSPAACRSAGIVAGANPAVAAQLVEGGEIPWTLLVDVDPDQQPQLVREESFVCVTAEIALDAASPEDFLRRAVDFANGRLWGTLSAALSVPPDFRAKPAGQAALGAAIDNLEYAAIGINHWPGLIYALMTPPWGGYPGGTLADPQSGLGWVHNTFMLGGVEKTVLEGPLVVRPKPVWFPTHRSPEAITWALFDLYRDPSAWRLPRLFWRALRG